MRAVLWQWSIDVGDAGRPAYSGFTDGTTWNGFANIWMAPDVAERVRKDLRDQGDTDTADDLEGIKPNKDGLICLGWGYATEIVP